MILDYVVPGETTTHFCRFQRSIYNWQQVATFCDYQAPIWTYSPTLGNDYCDYDFQRDVFSAPLYSYSYIPNPGDLLGQTFTIFPGNDDYNGNPTAVTYSGGSFSNGDCPNLVSNSATQPDCGPGVICKLAWASNTTIGATNYPRGRYSGIVGGPWGVAPFTYPSAEPAASLTDPLFPPNPVLYRDDWLDPAGSGVAYWVQLMANYYDPSASNPPRASAPATCGQLQLPVLVHRPPDRRSPGRGRRLVVARPELRRRRHRAPRARSLQRRCDDHASQPQQRVGPAAGQRDPRGLLAGRRPEQRAERGDSPRPTEPC